MNSILNVSIPLVVLAAWAVPIAFVASFHLASPRVGVVSITVYGLLMAATLLSFGIPLAATVAKTGFSKAQEMQWPCLIAGTAFLIGSSGLLVSGRLFFSGIYFVGPIVVLGFILSQAGLSFARFSKMEVLLSGPLVLAPVLAMIFLILPSTRVFLRSH